MPEPDLTDAEPALPRALQVEVTGSCNLACRMCLVAYRPKLGRSAHMSLATFRALLDDLPELEEVTLQGLGEPLLVAHLEEMVAEAVRRGIRVGFNTNGTLLTRSRSVALIAAGLDWIHVSVDGARAETYASIRHGGRLDVVLDNLRGLVAARQHTGCARPHIQLNTVLLRRNVEELEDLVRLAADIGVDRLWVQGLSHDFTDVASDPAFVEIRRWTDGERVRRDGGSAAVLAEHAGRARALAAARALDLRLPEGVEDPPPRPAGEPGCDWPWRSAYVGHDGGVQPCCMLMGSDRGHMGNVHEHPLSELWGSEGYRRLRMALQGPEPPDTCRGCAAYRRQF